MINLLQEILTSCRNKTILSWNNVNVSSKSANQLSEMIHLNNYLDNKVSAVEKEGVICMKIYNKNPWDKLLQILSKWNYEKSRINLISASLWSNGKFPLKTEPLANAIHNVPGLSVFLITLSAVLLRLNSLCRTKFNALPILVPPRGYRILLMRRSTVVLLLLWWKSSINQVREENSATPTRVRSGDTLNEDNMVLTNSIQRRKLPRPAASTLPDPSIRNTRSRRLAQTKTKIKRKSLSKMRSLSALSAANYSFNSICGQLLYGSINKCTPRI